MRFILIFIAIFSFLKVDAQFLAPFQGVQNQPKVQFDYWVYSTHGGSGNISQYPQHPTNRTDMDKIFNTTYTNTILTSSGRTNSAKILDWTSISELSNIGISLPNSGTYFSMKIQGTFIPLETGTYSFTLQSDDASDFTINGTSVVSIYSGQAIQALGTNTGNIVLNAGQKYIYEIRMQQGPSGFGLKLYWKSPTQTSASTSNQINGHTNTYAKPWTQNLQELVTSPDLDGSSASKAAPNAKYIQTAFTNTNDGIYWINLPFVGPTKVYCLLNSLIDGGGWMMMMKATQGNTFGYSSSHWTSITTLNDTAHSRADRDAKFNTMNYFYAKDMMALWPDIPWNYNSSTTGGSVNTSSVYKNWCWLQNNFNNGIRITPISFFNSGDKYFFGDANDFSGKGTAFSSQTAIRFYGFNYINASSEAKVRWGFGWNENDNGIFPNGNQASNDVSGGIGMTGVFQTGINYSAGDQPNCCQNTTGISRSARVEIYIR